MALLRNRRDAGRQLADQLRTFVGAPNTLVLALPRGGVPVAYEIAHELHLPLDVYLVRKLGVPGHEELAMGAIASDGTYVVDELTIAAANVDRAAFTATLEREAQELRRRSIAYRDGRPEPVLEGATLIVVDDGLATGASMYAAIRAMRSRSPASIVVAVPVAPSDSIEWLRGIADIVICPHHFDRFGAVGLYYDDFSEVSDDDVKVLLAQAESERMQWSVA